MAAARQGHRKHRGKRHLLDSAWPVKLFARLTELLSRDICANNRHFLLAQKSAKITDYRDTAPLKGARRGEEAVHINGTAQEVHARRLRSLDDTFSRGIDDGSWPFPRVY